MDQGFRTTAVAWLRTLALYCARRLAVFAEAPLQPEEEPDVQRPSPFEVPPSHARYRQGAPIARAKALRGVHDAYNTI